jgi:hypothetical protein
MRGDDMPDYRELYFTLFRASEQAVNTLIEAQRKCEELYISAPRGELLTFPGEKPKEP